MWSEIVKRLKFFRRQRRWRVSAWAHTTDGPEVPVRLADAAPGRRGTVCLSTREGAATAPRRGWSVPLTRFSPASPSPQAHPNASSYKGSPRPASCVKGQGFVGGTAGAEGESPLRGWTLSSTRP